MTQHQIIRYEYSMSRNFSESKILRFNLNIEYQILELCYFLRFFKIIKYLMAKQNVSLVIHDFSDLKRFANNAKIRRSISFYLYGTSKHLRLTWNKTVPYGYIKVTFRSTQHKILPKTRSIDTTRNYTS